MATTEAQLINFVLDNFRAIGTGQTATTDDVEKVRLYIPGVLDDLATTDTYYIADGDSVPDAAVHWVAALISHAPGLRSHFGEPQDIPSEAYCEARLRRLRPSRDFPILAVNYF